MQLSIPVVLTVAERLSSIESMILEQWPEAHVEANPVAGALFASTDRASVIITVRIKHPGEHTVLIRRHDAPIQPHLIRVHGRGVDVANEVAEALVEHFGPGVGLSPAPAQP